MTHTGTVLLLVMVAGCAVMLANGYKLDASERSKIVSEAIQEVKDNEKKVKANVLEKKTTLIQKKLRGFKMATPASRAIGKAQLRFERMVKVAERKIFQKQRQAMARNSLSRAESLAFELLHRPGKALTSQEIARIYSESECRESVIIRGNTCARPRAIFFRTANGICNNRENPAFGAAATAVRRLIPSQYDDGIFRAKGYLQSRASQLFSEGPFAPPNPSARLVSTAIIRENNISDPDRTHILMQWGQFLDHDLDLIPEHEPEDCPEGCGEMNEEEEATCYPIPVPVNDNEVLARSSASDRRCEPFQRSFAVCMTKTEANLRTGAIPPKQQINAITHFIDGSMVYHHNITIQRNLIRDESKNKGQLRIGPAVKGTTQPTLPIIDLETNPDVVACPVPPCFLAGDMRVNEQLSLTVMHTIWVREHNRIATELSTLNPGWSDNLLFQTARQIVGAMIQKITYKDFLPQILGDQMFKDLIPDYQRYDASVDPSVPNAFATAAYRFGHSLIQPEFDRLNNQYEPVPEGPLSLINAFFNSSALADSGGTDPIVRGLVAKNPRRVDEFLNSILTNRLFSDDPTTPGLDLASLNVQRGRDHGLPGYLTWKQWAERQCHISSDFDNSMTEILLLQTYGNLNNVDLFVGGLAERAIPGGLVGATFACIFGKTFTALRDGDRFYYESTTEAGSLTRRQRREIEKATLSRVLCDTSDSITSIQPNAFLATQKRVPCNTLPSVDLTAWQTSPRTCFMRVSANIAGDIEVVSRLKSQFRLSVIELPANRQGCARILCPGSTSKIDAVISASFRPRRTSCRVIPNNYLDESMETNFYLAKLSSSQVDPNTGVHRSRQQCLSSSTVAVRFSCTLSTLEAEVAETSEEDEVTKDVDESSELVGGLGEGGQNVVDALNSINPAAGASSTKTTSSTGKDKKEKNLISLMENVLAELQKTDKVEVEKKPEEEKKPEGENAISQLEDYFRSN